MTTLQELRELADKLKVSLGIHKGNGRDRDGEKVAGEITLDPPDGFRFDDDLHGLVIRQQRDPRTRQLEPWQGVVAAALHGLKGHALTKCPEDCDCREDPHDW